MKKPLSARLLAFMETLEVTQGPFAGQPLKVLPWQRKFVAGAFRDGITDGYLTIARAAGKTTLLAGLALAYVVCPEIRRRREEVCVVAASSDQAAILFEHALAFGQDALNDRKQYRVANSTAERSILHKGTGARLRVLSSDPRRAHGLAGALFIQDEMTQWPSHSRDAMIAAIRTARGKISNSRVVTIGTRPAAETHPFARGLDSKGTHVYVQRHQANSLENPLDRRQWHRANPSMRVMPELRKI